MNNEETKEKVARTEFGPRLGAHLIDLGLAIIVGGAIGAVVGASILGLIYKGRSIPGASGDTANLMGGIGAIMGGFVGIVLGYYILHIIIGIIEGFTGATPGKMMLKIKNASEDGTKAPAGKLWLRVLVKYAGTILGLVAIVTGISIFGRVGMFAGLAVTIGCFFVLGQKRQAFHDLAAKTAVYKKSLIK